MITLREKIAQLPPDSQKRIEEMTKALIAEEKLLRESNTIAEGSRSRSYRGRRE